MGFLTVPAASLPDASQVKGFFSSLTLEKVIPVVVLLLVGLAVIRLVMKLFDRALERSKLERAAYAMLRTGMRAVLYFLLILILAGQLGIDVTSLIAVFSVVSLALSLAVQGTLTNIVGGITLLSTHPFTAGDYVEIGSTAGTVVDVGVAYTRLSTPDNKVISIPNGIASSAQIVNYSCAGIRRVDISVTASYDSPVETVKEALLRAASTPDTLADPGVFAGVERYGDSAIGYVLRLWTTAEKYWDTFYAVNEAISREFASAGVEMTYPHINVHFDPEKK